MLEFLHYSEANRVVLMQLKGERKVQILVYYLITSTNGDFTSYKLSIFLTKLIPLKTIPNVCDVIFFF